MTAASIIKQPDISSGECRTHRLMASTLGNATSPGFELVDSQTLKAAGLTIDPAVDTSVSSKGFVTDNVHWTGDYPKDIGFVTYTDATGQHLLYHGKCGGSRSF